MTAALEIIQPGMMTTVQDFGRFGQQARGMSVSGAMDKNSMQLANSLVGNDVKTGVLEIRMLGPSFKVLADSICIALVGTASQIEVTSPEKKFIPSGRSVVLTHGDECRIGSVSDTASCYLAVEGGFDLPMIYGSQSTYTPGGFGGFEGRSLATGDLLPLNQNEVAGFRHRILSRSSQPDMSPVIRVVLGPQHDHFTAAGIETFLNSPYTISSETNRMGMRLDGTQIDHRDGFNIASDGIVRGAIQVPGHGLPIILLADCQTTGGYPKIATVISADLPKLGRMLPGTEIRFEKVSVADAERIARQNHADLMAQISSIREVKGNSQDLDHLLMSENLISGMISGD